MKKVVLYKDNEHLGEFQGKGSQIVGVNSIHPSGKKYEICLNHPIRSSSELQITNALGEFIKVKQKRTCCIQQRNSETFSIFDFIDISRLSKRGNELQGEHPLHGSETGMNFCVNPSKNTWHCFRCDSGGSALEWLAVREGLIDCSEAGPGCLRGDLFVELYKLAMKLTGKEASVNIKLKGEW